MMYQRSHGKLTWNLFSYSMNFTIPLFSFVFSYSFLLFFQPRLFLFALDRYLNFLHFLTSFLDFIFFQF